MTEEKISERDFIKLIIIENNIEVSIKYPRRSTLKNRFELMEKCKELMRKV